MLASGFCISATGMIVSGREIWQSTLQAVMVKRTAICHADVIRQADVAGSATGRVRARMAGGVARGLRTIWVVAHRRSHDVVGGISTSIQHRSQYGAC